MSFEWCVPNLFHGLEVYADSSAVFHMVFEILVTSILVIDDGWVKMMNISFIIFKGISFIHHCLS
jgi:hypothetical protein